MAIFSNFGSCYVLRINDVPASTGYGEPVQKLFNFRDGERVIAAYVATGNGPAVLPAGGQIIAVTKHGFGFRLNADPHFPAEGYQPILHGMHILHCPPTAGLSPMVYH